MRTLPDWVLDRLRRGMQMHGTSPVAVTRLVAEAGGEMVSIEEDTSAGPRRRSCLYVVRPRDEPLGDAPGVALGRVGRMSTA
jgi:hypothetical protein